MTTFTARLLRWYRRNARDLPWRRRVSPYRTWVSEVMLQQTRVDTVVPYYNRWMKRFPSMRQLANASEREVLLLWEGLGYYSRARNLHRTAAILTRARNGRIPRSADELRKLPGIGPSTAASIAAIAFGQDEATLDGNIRRVLSRVFLIRQGPHPSELEQRIWSLARQHLPQSRAGEYNQALMDLGATVCLPRMPHCSQCPVRMLCRAHRRGLQSTVPRVSHARRLAHHILASAVIVRGGAVVLLRRPARGLLGGLWEFPKVHLHNDVTQPMDVKQPLRAWLLRHRISTKPRFHALLTIEHAYSHLRVTVHAAQYWARGRRLEAGLKWVALGDLAEFPMGRVDRQIALRLQTTMAPAVTRRRNP